MFVKYLLGEITFDEVIDWFTQWVYIQVQKEMEEVEHDFNR
jgi:hypothetical protein